MSTDRIKIAALGALPFAALLIGEAASAQWRVVQPQSPEPYMRFAEMDDNGDGVITRSEWTGTRRAFNDADWNRDGILSGNEVWFDDDGAVGTTGTVDRRTEFLNFDGNGDGILSRSEWRGLRSTFDLLDVNNDGVVTRREYAANGRSSAGQAAAQMIFVDPQELWTRTGIFVNEGDVLAFNTQGRVQLSGRADDIAISAGALSGRRADRAPLPEALAGALIGRIGNGAPFGIGNQRQIIAPYTGELFLGVNDDVLGDNRGGFRVRVVTR